MLPSASEAGLPFEGEKLSKGQDRQTPQETQQAALKCRAEGGSSTQRGPCCPGDILAGRRLVSGRMNARSGWREGGRAGTGSSGLLLGVMDAALPIISA